MHPEYDPSRDTTTTVWEGLTYYCRAAVSSETTTGATTTIVVTTAPETTTSNTSGSTSTVTTTNPTTPGPGLPSVILPDADNTPGALNPKVRQGTIRKTICKSGWTKTIRPPVGYTKALKLEQMVQYGETGSPSEYEEDHLIPLELGGAPRNPTNLWPEPHSQSNITDPLETKLKRQVCKLTMTLAKARATIRTFKFTNG